MEFKDIISVPGKSGLYEVVANNKNGFIVESLQDGKRTMIASSQRIMTLSDVAVYTTGDELPLRELFKKMKDQDTDLSKVDLKGDQQKMRDFFKEILPEFDEEKVYNSDIKKMLTWYDILKDKIDFAKVEEKEEEDKGGVSAENEKPVPKMHEAHGPRTENAKKSTARTRKKV
jgi:hypothetical protein